MDTAVFWAVRRRRMAGAVGGAAYVYDNAEAAALVAAMTTAPSDTRKGVIDDFIGALKTAGVWSKLVGMYVPRAHHEQAGRLNWKSPGTLTLSAVNSPTFVADDGFSSNGSTSNLDLGANIGQQTGVSQNDVSLGGVLTGSAVQGWIWGRATTGGRYSLQRQDVQLAPRLSANAVVGFPFSNTNALQVAVRTGASAQECFSDGVSIGTDTTASTDVGTEHQYLLRATSFSPSTERLQLAFFGAALSAADVGAFKTAWDNYVAGL